MNDQTPSTETKPKSRGKKIALITGGVLLIGAITAFAGVSSYCRHGDHMEHAIDRVSDELKLDAAQREKLEELGVVLKEARKTMRDGDGVETVLSSVTGSTLDRDALNALAEAKISAARDQAPRVIAAVGDFYDGLNPQQQAEAREKIQWMADKVKSHRHRHHDDD